MLMLQLEKVEPETKTLPTPNAATAPPLTAKLAILAPRAVQAMKLHDVISNADRNAPDASTANAPPLLFEAAPVAPEATVTELLSKMQF